MIEGNTPSMTRLIKTHTFAQWDYWFSFFELVNAGKEVNSSLLCAK